MISTSTNTSFGKRATSTAERAGKYTMTYPIQNGTTVFVKRKGDDSIKSIEDMSGKKVGTQTSCYNEDDTKKFNEKLKSEGKDGYAELLKYDSFPEAFAELVRKEDTELSDYINSEIHKFKEDGTLAELQKKWFGEAVDLPESDYIPAE